MASSSNPGTLSFIFKAFRLGRSYILLKLLLVLSISLGIGYDCFFPIAMKMLIDTALPTKNLQQILLILATLGIGYVVVVAANLIEARIATLLSMKISSVIRLKMFRALQRIEIGTDSFENNVTSYLTDDIRHIESGIIQMWRTIRAFLTLIYGALILVVFDWRLALLSSLLLPLTLVFPKRISSKLTGDTNLWREAQSKVLSNANEARSMQNVIRVLRLRTKHLLNFKTVTKTATSATQQYLLRNDSIGRTGFLSIEFVKLLILAGGAFFVLNDVLSIGALFGFLGILAILNRALSGIISGEASLTRGELALDTVNDFLDLLPAKSPKSIQELPPLSKAIIFDDISVKIGDAQILSNINMSIRKGQSVAFVGPSGAGKSTALKLLLMDLKPSSGHIYFDNNSLDDVFESTYFSKIGAVFQEPKLFEGTIRENILIANPSATENELIEATTKAEIHNEILSFEKGFDTQLRRGSSQISGGQKQRIAIARALLNDPELLILDEASSALDPFTDAALEETIAKMHGTHTIVSVTHRLTSVKDFDQIYVFEKGKIADFGTHQELLDRKGLYANLWNKQNGIEIDTKNKTSDIKPDWLKSVPIFENLEDSMLKSLADEFVMERYDSGEVIFEEGSSGDKMYVIAAGIVEVSVLKAPGEDERNTLATFSSGDFFGEIALLFDQTRTARAKTKSVCVLLTLTRRQWQKLMTSLPESVKQEILKTANLRLQSNPLTSKSEQP